MNFFYHFMPGMTNAFSFYLRKSISPSFLKPYRLVGSIFHSTIFFFSCLVKKSLTQFLSLFHYRCFFLCHLSNFFLSLVFCSLNMICLGVFFCYLFFLLFCELPGSVICFLLILQNSLITL